MVESCNCSCQIRGISRHVLHEIFYNYDLSFIQDFFTNSCIYLFHDNPTQSLIQSLMTGGLSIFDFESKDVVESLISR